MNGNTCKPIGSCWFQYSNYMSEKESNCRFLLCFVLFLFFLQRGWGIISRQGLWMGRGLALSRKCVLSQTSPVLGSLRFQSAGISPPSPPWGISRGKKPKNSYSWSQSFQMSRFSLHFGKQGVIYAPGPSSWIGLCSQTERGAHRRPEHFDRLDWNKRISTHGHGFKGEDIKSLNQKKLLLY